MVQVEGLTKRFPVPRTWREAVFSGGPVPTRAAVDDVSFSVANGEIFGLLGQNGAGKTTLFKMLSTLILADVGTARIADLDVDADAEAVRRLVAPVLANERSLYWRLSAKENLRLFCALQGLAGAEALRETARVLDVTGLADTGAKMVAQFSTGMRQRLLIARALLARPRILLLDEPTRSLDPISARDLRHFLRETVVAREGCTILLATHDAEEVWELCDRVGVLEQGRLLSVGATSSLRQRAGGAEHELWVRASDVSAALAAFAQAEVVARRLGPADDPAWERLRCAIPGGTQEAADWLGRLQSRSIAVGHFERVAPSLADLIERVLADAKAGTHA